MKEKHTNIDFPNISVVLEKGFLTPRQTEVFVFLMLGLSNKQIAVKLRLAKSTIHNHIYGQRGATGRGSMGIFGTIEERLGERPASPQDMVRILIQKNILEISN